MGSLTQALQVATGESVNLAYMDQGCTGEKPATAAKRGFVLLPRRWVIEQAFS